MHHKERQGLPLNTNLKRQHSPGKACCWLYAFAITNTNDINSDGIKKTYLLNYWAAQTSSRQTQVNVETPGTKLRQRG